MHAVETKRKRLLITRNSMRQSNDCQWLELRSCSDGWSTGRCKRRGSLHSDRSGNEWGEGVRWLPWGDVTWMELVGGVNARQRKGGRSLGQGSPDKGAACLFLKNRLPKPKGQGSWCLPKYFNPSARALFHPPEKIYNRCCQFIRLEQVLEQQEIKSRRNKIRTKSSK